MELETVIETRRTVHHFRPQKVSDNVVRRAFELSLWAPNHQLTFPWRYYDVGEATRLKLVDLALLLKSPSAGVGSATPSSLSETVVQAVRSSIMNPSHLICLGIRKHAEPKRRLEDYATLACSVQIASLYLWAEGIGSKWSTGGFTMHTKTYEILSVSPEEVELAGALMIGVPEKVLPPVARPPLSELLRHV